MLVHPYSCLPYIHRREMDDGFDIVFPDQPRHQRLISGFANGEWCSFRHRPAMAGGKVVEHDDAFTGIDQVMDHLAADIPGPASYKERAVVHPVYSPNSSSGYCNRPNPYDHAFNGDRRTLFCLSIINAIGMLPSLKLSGGPRALASNHG